jgi:hypothetical protein
MKSGALGKAFAVLIAACCLVPLAALGAVIFLYWPILPTSLAALFVVFLLARRLFALLPTPESDEPRSSGNFSPEEGLLRRDHRQH